MALIEIDPAATLGQLAHFDNTIAHIMSIFNGIEHEKNDMQGHWRGTAAPKAIGQLDQIIEVYRKFHTDLTNFAEAVRSAVRAYVAQDLATEETFN